MWAFPFTLAIMIYGEDSVFQEIKVVFASKHLAYIQGGQRESLENRYFLHVQRCFQLVTQEIVECWRHLYRTESYQNLKDSQ